MTSFLTRATAALDRTVVRLMERRITVPRRRPHARPDHGDPRARLDALARAYSAGTLGAPSPFFPEPEVPDVRAKQRGPGCFDLTYTSTYVPFHAEARDLHEAVRQNHTAHARWWTTAGAAPRPTIVAIHGWGGGNPWVTARAFVAPYWQRHGFDVVTFVLPFHGPRAPGVSGALFPSANPLRTNEAFGQAIHDLRALARWLRERGTPAVGAMGMSLGGYTTALWASVAGRGDAGGLDFAAAMIPAVSMSRLMWKLGTSTPTYRRATSAGVTEELLGQAFAVHAPLTRPPRLPRERLAVIAGRGDQITPADHAEDLARHWGVDVQWFDGGHLAQVGRGETLRALRRQLAGLAL